MKFLTEKEVAAALAVSPKSLQKWRLLGKGPEWRKLCGAVRYPQAALERWLIESPRGGAEVGQ